MKLYVYDAPITPTEKIHNIETLHLAEKHLTFSCLRHTYATLQLDHGTDIYTISKMLGHRHLKTTQLYTRDMDKAKIEAANRIVLDL